MATIQPIIRLHEDWKAVYLSNKPGFPDTVEWWVDPADHTKAMPQGGYQFFNTILCNVQYGGSSNGHKIITLELLDDTGAVIQTAKIEGDIGTGTYSGQVVTPADTCVRTFCGIRATGSDFDAAPSGYFYLPGFLQYGTCTGGPRP